LFGGQRSEKWEKVLESVDKVRGRHGFDFIHSAKSVLRRPFLAKSEENIGEDERSRQ
jgi:hypothetical protein